MRIFALQKPKYYLLMGILIPLYLVLVGFCEEAIAIFDPTGTVLMSDSEVFCSAGLALIVALFILYVAHSRMKVLPNWGFFVFFLIFVILDAVAIFSFPDHLLYYWWSSTYYLGDLTRWRYFIQWIVVCVTLYLFFAIFPKTVVTSRYWNLFALGCVLLTAAAIIYSYIAEYSIYWDLLRNPGELENEAYPQSFAWNRNNYGLVLFVGMACSFYLYARNWRWYYPLIGFFYFLNQFFVMSKTCLLCSLVFLGLYLVWLYFESVRKHPKRNNIILGILFFLILAIVLFISTGLIEDFYEANRLYQEVKLVFENIDLGSLEFRKPIWDTIKMIMDTSWITRLCGVGDYNSKFFLNWYYFKGISFDMFSAHSGYFDVWLRFGWIGLALYGGLLVFIFYYILRGILAHRSYAYVSLFFFACMLLHAGTEDTNFLDATTKPLLLYAVIVEPVLTDGYQARVSNNNRFLESGYLSPRKTWAPAEITGISSAQLLSLAILPLATALFGFYRFFVTWFPSLFVYHWYDAAGGVILLFILPILLAKGIEAFKNKQKWQPYVLFAIAFLCLAGYFGFYLLWEWIAEVACLGVAILVAIFFLPHKSDWLYWAKAFFFVLLALLWGGLLFLYQYGYLDTHMEATTQVLLLISCFLAPLFIILSSDDLHEILFAPWDLNWYGFEERYFAWSYRSYFGAERRSLRILGHHEGQPS
jgi:hypothetical protein